MATWYVRTTGSDSAAGTSAATAFQTIGKAMTQASLAAGDTIYVGAGTYRITTTIAPTSMASMTYLYGDTDGSKTGDAGEIVVTNYGTSDSAAPSNVVVFTFASKNYWTIANMTLSSGGSNAFLIQQTSSNLTFENLTLFSAGSNVSVSSITFGTQHNIAFKRCRLYSPSIGVAVVASNSASGADYDAAITFDNCVVLSMSAASAAFAVSGTSNTYKMGGLTIRNSLVCSALGVTTTTAAFSTTYPVTVNNSVMVQSGTSFNANVSGQIVEDWNLLTGTRTNVTAGSNSQTQSTRNPRFSCGHEATYGGVTRPFGEFPSGSPLLTFGGTAVPTDDINGVTRPASGAAQSTTQQSLGPFERSNSATRETTTTRTGGTAIKIAGPGYHDFELAVSPVSTSVSVWSYKDATYGTAATGPQLIITNAGEAGFGGTTITSAGGTGTWAAMTATFTPTSAGIVTVRLQSNATVGSAAVYFDDFSVA